MSNESVVLWVDVQNNTLLSGWESNAQAPDPVFKQGDNLQAELHFVKRVSTQAGVFFEEVPTDGATFKFAIGQPDAEPISGTWTLAYGSDEQDFAHNVSAEDLATALNAFTDIIAQGGVTVESVNGNTTYRISFNNKTAVGDFTADGANLFPSSSVIIDQIKVGSPTVRGVWHIKPTQIPVAYQSTWTAQVPSAVTVETVQTGTTRLKISPAPKDGTFILSVGGVPTPAISVYATAQEIVTAIGDADNGFEVKKSGAFIWDITQTTTPLQAITANGAGIISFDSVVGNISFNNYETSTLLAGANSVRTTIEIEMTAGNTVTTVLQNNCVIVTNLINQTVYEPTPFETPLTDAPEDGSLYARKDGDWVSFTEEDNQGFFDLGGVAIDDNQTYDARNGSFLRFYRLNENSQPFAISRQAYWWNFPKNNESMPNAVLTAAFDYNDGEGNSMYGTVTVQVAFSKYIPRLNTGYVVLDVGETTTHSWTVGNKTWTQGTEQYGDILTLFVVDGEVNGVTYSDANEGISFSASAIVEGSEGSPPTLTWGMVSPMQTSYTLSQSEADSRDEPVMKRGLLSSFIQEIVGDKGFSLVLGTVPDPRYNLVWNAETDKFEIDRTLAASVETLQGSLTNYAVKAESNTFEQPQIITSNSASLPALRVTNTGTAATLLIEDSNNPDTNAFVVSNNGAVGIQRAVGWSPATGVFLDVGGKGVFTPTANLAGINIGSAATPPTSTVAGDVWIGTNLNYKAFNGSTKSVANTNASNTFTSLQVVSVTSPNTALRITQTGVGNAFVVEDGSSTNPDTDSFVIDNAGNVGVGVNPNTFVATEKLEVKGNIKFDDGTVQSTAFTGGIPTVANIAQARGFNNTANFLSPQMANWLMMSPNIIDITRAGFTVTNTGTISTVTAGWISSYTRTGTAGACSSRWRTFGLSQIDQVWSMTEKQNPNSFFNFSNPSWCSGRSLPLGITESVFSWGFYHGKAEADGVGQLIRRGYGWRCTGGAGSRFLTLEVHDGTTLTSVTSTYAVSTVAFDWDLISDGAGTVTLYVNGTQVATTTGGPTGLVNVTPAVWQEEVATSAASASPYNGMVHSRGKFIAFDPS